MYLICIVIFTSLLTCTESATYKERCGEPGKPTDGNYTDTGPYTIEYSCKNETKDGRSYRLARIIGNETRTCRPEGTWDNPIPWCEPNLFYKTNGTTFTGEEAILWERLYKKNGGSPYLDGNVTIKLLNRTAIKELVFIVEELRRRSILRLTVKVMNKTGGSRVNCTFKSYIEKDAVRRNDLITFKCFNTIADVISIDSTTYAWVIHFEIYGNSSVENETCGEPDIPANCSISSRTDQTVNYKCNQGLNLCENKIITCSGRQWSGNAPICIIDARQPGSIQTNSSFTTVAPSPEFGSRDLHRMCVIGIIVGFLVLVTVNVLVVLVICRKMKQKQERKDTIYDDVGTVSFTANPGSGNPLVQMKTLDSLGYPADNQMDDPANHIYESMCSNRTETRTVGF